MVNAQRGSSFKSIEMTGNNAGTLSGYLKRPEVAPG